MLCKHTTEALQGQNRSGDRKKNRSRKSNRNVARARAAPCRGVFLNQFFFYLPVFFCPPAMPVPPRPRISHPPPLVRPRCLNPNGTTAARQRCAPAVQSLAAAASPGRLRPADPVPTRAPTPPRFARWPSWPPPMTTPSFHRSPAEPSWGKEKKPSGEC